MSAARLSWLRSLRAPGPQAGNSTKSPPELTTKRSASEADASADFERAHRLWHIAARREPDHGAKVEAIMRSARARQMADDWRVESGHWEWLGNTLGKAVDSAEVSPSTLEDRYGTPRGRESFAPFYVISDEEWDQPVQEQAYEDHVALARHRQASAYQWAGERAAAAGQHDEAARLYRRAGITWERSEHPQREERAAACYYRAAASASQSLRRNTRRRIFDGWCPSCLRDKARENSCGTALQRHEEPLDARFANVGDLDRLAACSRRLLESTPRQERGQVFREASWQFGVIQHTLAAAGDRHDAIRTYRKFKSFERQYYLSSRPWRWPMATLNAVLSCYGSRVKQTLLTLFITAVVVCPALWRASGNVRLVQADGAIHQTRSWLEALTFSLSGMINLDTGHFAPSGTVTTLFQAVQAISAYFALGYVLWIAQRSYSS